MADRKKRQQTRGDAQRDEERQSARRASASNGTARAGSTGGRTGTKRQLPEQRVARYEKSPNSSSTLSPRTFSATFTSRAALEHLGEGSAIVNPGSIHWPRRQQAPGRLRGDEGCDPRFHEVAPAFVFFASNADSSYITGEVSTLLGGEARAA
jgi:hypothetical protein